MFLTGDQVGSTRLVTGGTGTLPLRHDYRPFGEQLGTTDNPSVRSSYEYSLSDFVTRKFTGKERDAETGLDYFGARYFSSAQGRFTSPDPSGAAASNPSDPQSWNMYAYGRNNPLLYFDPDGLTFRICDMSGNCDDSYSDASFYQNLDKTSRNGNIYGQDGTKIGTYERTIFDDLGPLGNSLYQGMAGRRQASNQFIAGFAVTSAAVGVTGGAFAGAGATLPGQGALGLGGNIGGRLLPVGVTLQRFANDIIKWGKDAQGKAASLARIATLNLEGVEVSRSDEGDRPILAAVLYVCRQNESSQSECRWSRPTVSGHC